MRKLKFGTGGAPISTKGSGSAAGVKRIRELGLSCMEVEWVQSAPSTKDSKSLFDLKDAASIEPQVVLSCHASYYVNLAGEPEVIGASRDRIQRSARALSVAGGRNVVFHSAFYKNLSPAETFKLVLHNLQKIQVWLNENGVKGVMLRPEATGKPTQFGSLDEIIELCKELPGSLPCIDFAHLHARGGGGMNSYKDFSTILEGLEKGLGQAAIKDMHIHVSGIEYTAKGERKHLKLEESDMDYKGLLKALKDFKAEGTVICESPVLEDDALLMQKYFDSL